MTVRDALADHYAAHGLPADGGESATTFVVRMGPFALRVPNPPARRRAVFFHDVNHVLTGYNTVFSDGEMVIAAFEIGTGCGPYWIAWFINSYMMGFGLAVRPRDVFRAFVRGRHAASIYRRAEDRDELSAMPVGELRTMLGLDRPARGASITDRIRFGAWSIAAIGVSVAPIAAGIAVALRFL
ncbi:MAG TPA: hypothetical protein VIP11_08445 [Gemmatimonadaceae bacterium]